MKRILALSLVAVLLVCSFASCGSGNNGGGKGNKFDMSNVTNLSNLSGATIAAQTGTFHLDALNAQTSGVTIKEYPDFTQLLVALNSGAIDGYVAEEPTAYAVISQNPNLSYVALKNNDTGFTATDADTGIAVAFKTGSGYVSQVNTILAGISAETRAKLMQQAVTMSTDTDATLSEAIVIFIKSGQVMLI